MTKAVHTGDSIGVQDPHNVPSSPPNDLQNIANRYAKLLFEDAENLRRGEKV